MTATKARVSLCMIVRNEEQNLADCLGPVADLFDEIIIVDTGSHDKTKEVAQRFTPHVFDFTWCDDFSAARNETLRHATGDWIFWLDADDRVRPSQVATLRQILSQLDDQPRVLVFKTLLPPATPGSDRLFVSHPRLFRRHPQLQWHGRVHEQLGPEAVLEYYQSLSIDLEIEHVGYLDRAFANRKARLKLRLLRMDYAVDPDDVNTLLHMGSAQLALGNHAEAKRCFQRILDMNLGSAECMRRVYDMLIQLSYLPGEAADAAGFTHRALNCFPDDEIFLFTRAKLRYLDGDFAATIRELEYLRSHARPRNFHYQTPTNVKTRLAPLLLAAAYRMQQDYARAERTLEELIRVLPNDCEALFNLGMAHLDEACWPKFVELVHRLAATAGGATGAALLTAKMLLRQGDFPQAARLIDQIIDQEPYLPRARMLRTEYLALSKQPLEIQIQAHRDLLRIDPANCEVRAWLKRTEQLARPATLPQWSANTSLGGAFQDSFESTSAFGMAAAPATMH